MENASKALLMTGSILIGIILLSLAVYIYNVMSDAKKMEASAFSEEQLVKYNMEFLSYDKSVMYGTDVITVLNKAIDNNKRYDDDDSMYIDVAFILKDDVNAVTIDYTWNETTRKYDTETKKTKADKDGYNFVSGEKYSVFDNLNEIKNFLATSKHGTGIKKQKKSGDGYTITYTGFSDFKRMIFKCNSNKTKYNGQGKICYMEFEQVKTSTYNTDK